MIAEIETALAPRELLKELKGIERDLGRDQKDRWGSRLIDLDIIFYGSKIIDEPDLKIPHPQAHLRSFVLEGICQLEPDMLHPRFGRTCRRLKDRLGGHSFFIDASKPLLIEMSGPIGVGKTTLAEGLTQCFGAELLKEKYDENPYLPLVYEGRDDLALKSELFFLNNSLSELKREHLRAGRVYVADYMFEKSSIYPKMWLSEDDYRIFEETYRLAAEDVAAPTLVIDIYDSAQNCLERIRNRSRKYEQDITADFLDKLMSEYALVLKDWDKSPVIRLDAGANDFRESAVLDKLYEEIALYVKA
jgi:deoxyadenosine/deoxycytidine kinase